MTATFKKIYQGSPLAAPTPTFQYPTSASTGGTLTGGAVRYYQVTAVVDGAETLPSTELAFTVPSGTNTNTVTLYVLAVPGATAYNWYAATTSGSEVQIGSTSGSTTTFTDTGASGSGTAVPTTTSLVEATATPGLYVCPAGKQALVRRIMVSNPTSVSGSVSLSHVTSGGVGGVANRVIASVPIAPDANGSGPLNESLFLAMQPGDFLTGSVTVAGMVISLFGMEL